MTGFKVQNLFFDRQPVIDAMAKKDRAALSKGGAFVRTRARSSMKRRKKVAERGKPPSAHVGKIKDLLYFSYDPHSRSVVIGPAKFREGIVPRLMEEGGRGPNGKTYEPHPYMGPALQAELPNLPSRWSGSLNT